MEFVDFLNSQEKQILNLIYQAGYSAEENTPLCLLSKKYFGFLKKPQKSVVICTQNAKDVGGYMFRSIRDNDDYSPTKIYIRRALRHEAVHVAQGCNKDALLNMPGIKKLKFNKYKEEALKGSTMVSGNKLKEKEAYTLEDRPKVVIKALKKFCFNE